MLGYGKKYARTFRSAGMWCSGDACGSGIEIWSAKKAVCFAMGDEAICLHWSTAGRMANTVLDHAGQYVDAMDDGICLEVES